MDKPRDELGERVAATMKQDFEGTIEGPHRIGPYLISRVWTHDSRKDEYHAHYAVERGRKLSTFDDFSPFATWLANEFDLDAYTGRTERKTRLAVATLVVVVSLGLLVYLMVWDPGRSSEIKYLLSAIVGSAASYVFLKRPGKRPQI